MTIDKWGESDHSDLKNWGELADRLKIYANAASSFGGMNGLDTALRMAADGLMKYYKTPQGLSDSYGRELTMTTDEFKALKVGDRVRNAMTDSAAIAAVKAEMEAIWNRPGVAFACHTVGWRRYEYEINPKLPNATSWGVLTAVRGRLTVRRRGRLRRIVSREEVSGNG